METKLFLLILLLAFIMISGSFSATFTFENKCPYTVWPGILTNPGVPPFPSTGFELQNRASQSFNAQGWAGRFWARTDCTNTEKFTCATADCGSGQIGCNGAGAIPPASLVEMTMNGGANRDTDFYDISLVDGFNLPLSVTPQGGSGCKPVSCEADVNSLCPTELSVKGPDGNNIACKSACLVFNQPQYCCTGQFGSPTTCPPTNYSKIFKDACPQAYSYAYDDKTSTFTCPTGANYLITFCS
ncbi:hypothetical protein IFM89_033314 [Coptis chinensis]|uniref:Thaumatin-like protein n=1 Tax=Coptis chinensis TaxID=261450 RepID=A0A835HII9_9MAGN|nr:hypothetical protein IFM89_033314 [Coptis chinensis]